MATNDHDIDLAICKPFIRCEGGTDQVSQSPELGLEGGASETTFSESHQELVPCPRVEGAEPHVEGEEPGAMPTSRTAVLVRKERIKQDGPDLEVTKQNITSDSDSDTGSLDLDAFTSPKHKLSRNFSDSTCTTASPQSQHILSDYSASSDDSEGVVDGCKGCYKVSVQEKKRGSVHRMQDKEGQGSPTQAHRTVLPPEYQFSVRPHMFASQWSKTKEFKGGGLKVKTTTALSPNNTSEASGDCETNATVTITVKNAKLDCQYKAVVKVTLYDPYAGNILSDKEEEEHTGDHGHAKFTVSLGSLKNPISSRTKDKLSLQVKVKVHEHKTVPLESA